MPFTFSLHRLHPQVINYSSFESVRGSFVVYRGAPSSASGCLHKCGHMRVLFSFAFDLVYFRLVFLSLSYDKQSRPLQCVCAARTSLIICHLARSRMRRWLMLRFVLFCFLLKLMRIVREDDKQRNARIQRNRNVEKCHGLQRRRPS